MKPERINQPEHTPQRGPRTVMALTLLMIMGISSKTQEEVRVVMENPDENSSPVFIPQPPLLPVTEDFPEAPQIFRPSPPSDPLPTNSTGNVNMGALLMALNGCGVYDQCLLNACHSCGQNGGVIHPFLCETEDGPMYVNFDPDTQTIGFFQEPSSGKDSYNPAVFWSNDDKVFCERLNAYEEERGGKMQQIMDYMTEKGWFIRNGKKNFSLRSGTDFTMMIDGERHSVEKVKVNIGIGDEFSASIGIFSTWPKNILKTIVLEADSIEELIAEIDRVLMDEYELKVKE